MIIRQATENDYEGIISLFKRNYNRYHYEQLLNYEQLFALFSKNLLGWVALDKELVIGFAGLYEEENRIIKLAHLLVDENYRGYHLGSLLETKREDYYQKIESGIILASCVDTPPQSMFLKKKHSFHFLGARVNYRPSPLHRGHSILMGKYNRDIKLEYL